MNRKTLLILSFATAAFVAAPLAAQQAGERGPGPRHERMFERADADGDGLVTFDEFASGPLGHFAEADTDGDGALSQTEADAVREAHMARREERREQLGERCEQAGFEPGDGEQAERPRRGHGPGGHGPGDRFERADADGDGIVTDAEFIARIEEHFARIDADGDGVVTAEEAESARPPRGGRR